jgi:hypothetical protein
MARKQGVKAARPRRDDLPTIGVSRLRASGVIKPDALSVWVSFGEGPDALRREIGVAHVHFPNGGSWSFFLAPCCGRKARTLRLYDGRVVCGRCDGLMSRTQADWRHPAARAELIEGLRRRLATAKTRRKRLEISLRRALVFDRRQRLGKILDELGH